MDPEPAANRARPRLVTASVLCLLLAAALRLPSSDQLAVALLGALAAPLATIVAWMIVGSQAAAWAGMLVALSPIHSLVSRAAGPEAPLVLLLLAALWLMLGLELDASPLRATAVGFALGTLVASGVPGFAAVALVSLIWLTWRPERRALGALAVLAAVALVGTAALLGLARSPFDYGEIPTWIPETTLEGVVRCAGASFTRVIGLEYQLVVPHARYVLPLSVLFVALMLRGATRLPARPRGLLLAGASFPFALGAAMALITGRVTPLQANRLLAALPFVALLTAAGLASLSGTRAWAAGTAVAGTLAAFLALALGR
jgi:4-amino-4-deoxy-L-arabinose transferase-like glycosyltransferase